MASTIGLPAHNLHPLIWIIFALVYIGMALGKLPGLGLDRTGVALLGGIAMIGVGAISLPDAARSIDYETLLLLFSLMLFSAQLRLTGFYGAVGRALARATERPKRLLAALLLVSAFLSSLLSNDIICLSFTPVLCVALLSARRNPIPYLVALATGSNLGSAATLIGNPQNMYIGVAGQLPFAHFTLVMFPIVAIGLGICWGIVVIAWPKDFSDGIAAGTSWSLHPDDADNYPLDRPRMMKTLGILAALVAAFLFLPAEGRVIAALCGAGLLLVSPQKDSARLYQLADWDLLLLFVGLFVVNGTLKQSGLMNQFISALQRAGNFNLHHLPTLAAVTTGLSNVISNVPAVLLLRPSIPQNDRAAWYILAMSSTWAGNLTLVGSIANLIVAEQAARFGVKVDLMNYCRTGIAITLLTVAMGTIWIIWVVKG
jgi:Na+/H+ antiporter NhaD/arsenite permease-like protein